MNSSTLSMELLSIFIPIAVNKYINIKINNHCRLFTNRRTKYSVFGGQNIGFFKLKLMVIKLYLNRFIFLPCTSRQRMQVTAIKMRSRISQPTHCFLVHMCGSHKRLEFLPSTSLPQILVSMSVRVKWTAICADRVHQWRVECQQVQDSNVKYNSFVRVKLSEFIKKFQSKFIQVTQ